MSPDSLNEAPELACVEILAHAAQVARAALITANPELQEADFIGAVRESGSLLACAADAVITHLEALDTTLNRYRELALNPRTLPTPSRDTDI